MKVRTIIAIAVAAILPTLIALADKYDDLVEQGYRWVTIDGPFACTSKDDVQRTIQNKLDANTQRLIEEGQVYFLIRGAIVKVVQEDTALGLSQFYWDGIEGDLWTSSNFLSKRPITNILGTIATPSQPIGSNIPGITSQPDATATPSETATPNVSPTP